MSHAFEGMNARGPFIGTRKPSLVPVASSRKVTVLFDEEAGALIIEKDRDGFDDADCLAALDAMEQAEGWVWDGRLRYIVFDLAHERAKEPPRPSHFDPLLYAYANLILRAPVISLAIARGDLSGSDLEIALASNAIIASSTARVTLPRSLDGVSGRLLAGKMRQDRALALMERGASHAASDLVSERLVAEVHEPGNTLAKARHWMHMTSRKHNAAYLIYRAQRVVNPVRWSALTR